MCVWLKMKLFFKLEIGVNLKVNFPSAFPFTLVPFF